MAILHIAIDSPPVRGDSTSIDSSGAEQALPTGHRHRPPDAELPFLCERHQSPADACVTLALKPQF